MAKCDAFIVGLITVSLQFVVYPCHHLCGLYPDHHHICRDPIGLPTTGGIPYFITGAVPLSGGSRNFQRRFQVQGRI